VIIFEDPFERLLQFASSEFDVSAVVAFVSREELPRISWWRRAKGVTIWPTDLDSDELPIILIDGGLRRGIGGTLDNLAHELAHVIAGPDAEHGPAWKEAYHHLYQAACEQTHIERYIQPMMSASAFIEQLKSTLAHILIDSGQVATPNTIMMPNTALGRATADYLRALDKQYGKRNDPPKSESEESPS
jgi:hypothetical protein